MPIDSLIITFYCEIEKIYDEAIKNDKLRKRGRQPSLSDVEVLTMLVAGEYLGLGSERYGHTFAVTGKHGFLGCRTSFTRQCSNLVGVYNRLQQNLSHQLCQGTDFYLFDGFPIPVCHIKRYKQSSPFRGIASAGYCAAKDKKYFGFEGHLLMTHHGVTKAVSVAPAHIDERDILPELISGLTGDIIADKGLIRPHLKEALAHQGLKLHTPLRNNMHDPRPKSFLSQIMNVRRKVETVIGQLVERFKIQSIRAKDHWHLMAKVGRKIFAHTLSFYINTFINPQNPLQIDKLLSH